VLPGVSSPSLSSSIAPLFSSSSLLLPPTARARSVFESFPYVCPESVVVKCSFCIQMAKTDRLHIHCENSSATCRNASFFECFPYVCRGPVLVKRSFISINGIAKRRVS
jgi:hypothetical protein